MEICGILREADWARCLWIELWPPLLSGLKVSCLSLAIPFLELYHVLLTPMGFWAYTEKPIPKTRDPHRIPPPHST
jgi:hypothetical protein